MEPNRVSVGITSIIGWITALLGLLPTIIKSIESGVVAFNGPEKYLAIAGIASGLITNIGRYLQAHKMIGTSESVEGLLDTTGLVASYEETKAPRDNSVLASQTPNIAVKEG